MRKTPTGKRPQLDQGDTKGWSWPRLIPQQDQSVPALPEESPPSMFPKAPPTKARSNVTVTTSTMNEDRLAADQGSMSPISVSATETGKDGLAVEDLHINQSPGTNGISLPSISTSEEGHADLEPERIPGSFDDILEDTHSAPDHSAEKSSSISAGSMRSDDNKAHTDSPDETAQGTSKKTVNKP